MNQHYNNAIAALQELNKLNQSGLPTTEASAMGAMQTQAILAVAEEQSRTNALLQTANLIAYAQLCNTMRDGAKFAKARAAAEQALRSQASESGDDGEDL